MSDRRHGHDPVPGGDRHADPKDPDLLTPAQCARRLGVGSSFVIGEILDGRLIACTVLRRPGKRTVYRVHVSALNAYIAQYNWSPPRVSNS